ncbi:MAG: hypothetical protein WC378_14690 [Opitutaceae bacterium]
MKILETIVSEIQSEQVRRLLWEMAALTGQDLTAFENRLLLHCLQACIHPNGAAEKPVPITSKDLDSLDGTDSFLLRRKVGKIDDEALFAVCCELAAMPPSTSIENFSGTSLHVFLMKRLITKRERPKPIRWGMY